MTWLKNYVIWPQQAEHKVAQQLGKTGWYKRYKVEVVKILRAYANSDALSKN